MALGLTPQEIVDKGEYPLLAIAPHWKRIPLSEVAKVQNGFAFKSEFFDRSDGMPLIRIRDIAKKETEHRFNATYEDAYVVKNGDILVGMDGDFLAAHWQGSDALLNQRVCRLIPESDHYDKKFFFLCLQPYLNAINAETSSVTVKHLSSKTIEQIPLPFPPIDEQRRIVAKIEELFSELDKGIQSLKTARNQLKRYRQSLLKHAFEGKLTAKWREANKDKLESPDQLLKRIQKEREERHRTQLAEWKKQGQIGPKPKAPKTLPPLTTEELAELPTLPEGWGWVKYDAVCEKIKNGISAKPEGDSGTKIFRISAVRAMEFDMDDVRYLDNSDHRFDEYYLQHGDLVFTRYNGSRAYVGVCAEYKGDGSHLYPDKLIQTRLGVNSIGPSFLAKAINCGESRRFIESRIRTTAGQSGISGSDIKSIPVPVCSQCEQNEITQILETRLSEIGMLEKEVLAQLSKAELLRQSILKKAFSGQLVTQVQNETATILAECVQQPENKQQTKTRRSAPRQPKKQEPQISPDHAISFPAALPGIAAKDLHAGILAMAYRLHEQHSEHLQHFGHVKAEKISHLVEAHLGISLERQPVKDAAGPNDYPHLKKMEYRARMANWFSVTQLESGRYVFYPKNGFERLLEKTHQALGVRLAEVEQLLKLMLPMSMRQAEIFATTYAAWNNLLLLGQTPSDEEIVTEARENWHKEKLKIEREKFFLALSWMRERNLVPSGRGKLVKEKSRKTK